jgi:hypothetical protein
MRARRLAPYRHQDRSGSDRGTAARRSRMVVASGADHRSSVRLTDERDAVPTCYLRQGVDALETRTSDKLAH